MPVSSIGEARIKEASILELEKMVKLIKDKGVTIADILHKGFTISKVELMLLDSAFKNLSLEAAEKTLLVLSDQYIKMLQNLTLILVKVYYS